MVNCELQLSGHSAGHTVHSGQLDRGKGPLSIGFWFLGPASIVRLFNLYFAGISGIFRAQRPSRAEHAHNTQHTTHTHNTQRMLKIIRFKYMKTLPNKNSTRGSIRKQQKEYRKMGQIQAENLCKNAYAENVATMYVNVACKVVASAQWAFVIVLCPIFFLITIKYIN